MLHNALGVLGLEKDVLDAAFERAGIDPARRAESLGVDEFITLANAVFASGGASTSGDGQSEDRVPGRAGRTGQAD
jgi:hypothetical protein